MRIWPKGAGGEPGGRKPPIGGTPGKRCPPVREPGLCFSSIPEEDVVGVFERQETSWVRWRELGNIMGSRYQIV